MAKDFQSQLENISSKLIVLTGKYRALEEAYRAVKNENTDLKAQLLARQKDIDDLKVENEYLRVASALRAISPDKLEETKATIANLIQDVDKCIADLLE